MDIVTVVGRPAHLITERPAFRRGARSVFGCNVCGQGESNSRLILGKDVLYHLTMPAVITCVAVV